MKAVFSIFPKYYKHLDVHGLASLVREVGLDTTNVIIRDGYWASPSGLAADMPVFMHAMRVAGLNVSFATTDYSVASLLSDPTPLAILADNGITDFRLGYFKELPEGPRASFTAARSELERLVPICERYGLRAVSQLHHNTMLSSPSAAWHVINGLPARWIGIELDPGNQSFEGYEDWGRTARLLAGYIVAAAVKDTLLMRDALRTSEPDKGWQRTWAPIDEGVVNWHDFLKSLAVIDFAGSYVFMPFYHEDNPELMTDNLKREVAYLRQIMASINI